MLINILFAIFFVGANRALCQVNFQMSINKLEYFFVY